MEAPGSNAEALRGYYRLHAGVYDLTRWAFLFGRRTLVAEASRRIDPPARILEIGCGTGKNLAALARAFPKAHLVGLDLSAEMLGRAKAKLAPYGDRVELLHRPYAQPLSETDGGEGFGLVVVSYALSMMNPGYGQVLAHCRRDLGEGGVLAVADFHDTRHEWFRRWMGVNHVRMEGHLLAALESECEPLLRRIGRGYGGLWEYFVYLGR